MQTTLFQHDKIWIIFNIFYTIYICYTNTQIIVLKTPEKFLTLWPKYDKYWDLPKENCEFETFQADLSLSHFNTSRDR